MSGYVHSIFHKFLKPLLSRDMLSLFCYSSISLLDVFALRVSQTLSRSEKNSIEDTKRRTFVITGIALNFANFLLLINKRFFHFFF